MDTSQLVRAVSATDEDGNFTARAVAIQPAFYASQGMDFNLVLAFKLRPVQEPYSDAEITYNIADVVGKCVLVGDVVSVVPWDVLHDT